MRNGYSLVELMLTVMIIGVLTVIAVPNIQEMVYRARRAEATTNLRGIADAAVGYFAASDTWVTGASNPGAPIGKAPQAWRTGEPGWRDLGWSPDGLVRCTYAITALDGDTWARTDAECDVDGDGVLAVIQYDVPGADREGSFADLYPSRY